MAELGARLAAERERRFVLMGLKGAGRALALREAGRAFGRPLLVVTPLAREAEALHTELSFFMGEAVEADPISRRLHLYPAWELRPLAPLSPALDIQSSQLAALYALLRQPTPVVLTSVEALMTRTLARERVDRSVLSIAAGDMLERDALLEALVDLGFQRLPQAEEPGDFSVRGGIIDLFSPLYTRPVRLEFEGDRVVSIRRFEPRTQRSLEALEKAVVCTARYMAPARLKEAALREKAVLRAAEIGLVRKEQAELVQTLESAILFPGVELLLPYACPEPLACLLDYLPGNTVIWLVEPGRLAALAARFTGAVAEGAEKAQAKPAFYPPPETLYLDSDELSRALESAAVVEVEPLVTVMPLRPGYAPPIEIACQPSLKLAQAGDGRSAAPSFEPLVVELKEAERAQRRTVIVVEGQSQVARLRRHLEAYDLAPNTQCPGFAALLSSDDFHPAILDGEISAGVALPLDGLYVYSEEEVFGEPRVRRRLRRPAGAPLLAPDELKSGDLVVHIDHGIARYRGLKHMRVGGTEGDFLNLEFAGNDTMYVPVPRINLVQRYVGSDGSEAKLDRLGGGSWDRVKKRARKAMLAMAAELIEIYAAREAIDGHSFLHPGAAYEEFAARFEFEETPDQAAAIDDVILDLTRPRPTDRLICGDAGFGKTEVALRAAFIAVMDGHQVAVLVPTTVLAEQHLGTFRARFKDYPVRIEVLSRFHTPRENRAVLEGLERGAVDIVIGTHRLLRPDVRFRKLGLLIVDEEHRFGVADKERIKRLRKLVDTLTMTATPIPRTLQMAMLAIRDLSVIQTPPPDRQAIRTFVAHFDDGLIREVIVRELNRGGQVFFVHNRVATIEYMARHVQALVPEARLAVAHGQMTSGTLERVMREFVANRVNVLVCSAIIESGLDIPNANTMIINRADQLGLAQLYQLRGRIGRSRQRAYAYLLIAGEHVITREARRRLEALRELIETEGGSGFKLALHDLEQRGAGNLLGREQSGHIDAVGFELYTEMMQQAIAQLRGEPQRPDFEPELRLGIPAYIPESCVPSENERLMLYRRMARAESEAELNELREEMRDRFGPVPTLVENLLRAMNLRRRMKALMVATLVLGPSQLELQFHPEAALDPARLLALLGQGDPPIRFTPDLRLRAPISAGDDQALFAQIEAVLNRLAGCESLEHGARNAAGQFLN